MAGIRTLHGGDPWRWSELAILNRHAFPYPAAAALVFVPAATLSPVLGYLIYTALCLAAVAGTLWLCGVRDWRVYGVVLLWAPVVWGWRMGNLTLPLIFGTAFVWSARDRPWLAGVVFGVLISVKAFVWPLGLWLIATRRYRAGLAAIASGLALNVLSWSLYGWGRVWAFIRLSAHVTATLDSSGYGLAALMSQLRLGWLGVPVTVVTSLALGLAVIITGRARNDARALVLATVLMLVASPLIWSHYFALLLLPLAIQRPRMDRWWWAPVLLWIGPVATPALWQILCCWAFAVAVVIVSVRTRATRRMAEPLVVVHAHTSAADKAVLP